QRRRWSLIGWSSWSRGRLGRTCAAEAVDAVGETAKVALLQANKKLKAYNHQIFYTLPPTVIFYPT
ncbi:MAG: hypothetical protein WCR21_12355, partial [Bacteroidota bacterium]